MRLRFCVHLALAWLVCMGGCAPSVGVPGPRQIQAWAVYFDGDRGLAELQQHGELLDRVSLFAYELDPNGSPTPAPNMAAMIRPFMRLAGEKRFDPWVTVVNDVRYSSDSVVAKDSTLVHRLLADSLSRRAHARELTSRVSDAGFKGLHLDYEQIPVSDSSAYRTFIGELVAELRQQGLELEVVVEPARGVVPATGSASVVVMAYDLFGTHSGPGPRSTPAFVSEIGPRARADRDSAAALAVAVRGFAWSPDGEVNSLDWSSAQQLAAEAERTLRNSADVPSANLDDGTEIWFEDPASVVSKWQAAWEVGFRRLAIWRLGGNDERLFALLRDLRPDSN